MAALIAFLFFPFGLLSTGYFLLRVLGLSEEKSGLAGMVHVTAAMLGMLFFSYYWFVLGLFGLLNHAALYLYGTLSLFLIWLTRAEWISLASSAKKITSEIIRSDKITQTAAYLMIAVLATTFLRCFAGFIEGDSLVYHLYLPKQFVMKGAVWAVPFSEHAFWPLAAEMTFIPGELLKSLPLSKLASYLVYLSFVALTGCFLYAKTKNITSAAVTALAAASIPTLFVHAPSTYNDLFFGTYLAAAFLLYELPDPSVPRPLTLMGLAGLLAGGAMAGKYTAVFGVLALGLILILDFFRSAQRKKHFRGCISFIAGLIVTGAPYYFRSYVQYGNPVFPFAPNLFGTSFGYLSEGASWTGSSSSAALAGAGRGILDLLALPLNVTFRPELFLGDKIGFLLLPASILIFFAWRRNMKIMFFCLVYILCWFYTSQVTRYLIPVLALWAVMIGLGFKRVRRLFPRAGAAAFVILVILGGFQSAWAGYHAYKDFFVRAEEDITPLAKRMNEFVDQNDLALIVGDSRVYDFNFVIFREKTFRNFTRYPELPDEKAVLELFDENEIQYLIMVHRMDASEPVPFNPSAYFQRLIDDQQFKEIHSEISRRGHQYTLYQKST